ncbi:MAG: hypothetical protein MJ213_05130, partial [Bacilli bacterium]|nr:hypothetical protein [Bacilli bacterium]
MKNGFFKKILLGATCLLGVLTMASCQSTNTSEAKFVKEQSTCEIIRVNQGETRVRVSLAVINNTIYDIKGGEVRFRVTHKDVQEPEDTRFFTIENYSGFYIPHGVAGYIGGEITPDQTKYSDITKVEVLE